MIKRLLPVLIFLALLFVVVPPPCQAQSQIAVLSSTAQVDFPAAITFKLKANSAADITDVRLRYQIDKVTSVRVFAEVAPDFTLGPVVEVNWTREMRKTGALPPGADLQFWWVIRDSTGEELETTPTAVGFDDLRYSWKGFTQGAVSLFWYQGNQSFAQGLMDAAHEALDKLADDTGAYLEKPVRIYIYANSTDLQGALVYPQEWTGGAAFVEYGIVAIGISPGSLEWGKWAIAHELAHLVTYQVTFNPYAGIPTWLNEGLSMYAQGGVETGMLSIFDTAIAEDDLISVRSLISSFPADPLRAYLSYAQSYSLVKFLINTYGRDQINQLLSVFKEGSRCDPALERVYGFDTDGFEERWRAAIGARSSFVSWSSVAAEQPIPTLV